MGALRLWLIGQLIQMVMIGVLATIAVWALGCRIRSLSD